MSTLQDIEVLLPPPEPSDRHGDGFVDCRGHWHAWDEED